MKSRHATCPFYFRKSRILTLMSTLDGTTMPCHGVVWNGQWHTFELPSRTRTPDVVPMLAELTQRVLEEIEFYRRSGQFTEAELRTVEALWRDGKGLRAFSREERISPQAIESRIKQMQFKAIRFYQWWRLKHQVRSRLSIER